MGCWQPSFPESNPFGEVHVFRMGLWAALFGVSDAAFRYPGTIECVTRVKEFAYHNWRMYNGPVGSSTPGNLLVYPINVMPGGGLENLPDVSHFPDFPGDCRVMGKKSAMLPQKLTT